MRLACVFVPRFPLAVASLGSAARPQPGAPRRETGTRTEASPPIVIYDRNRVVEASPRLAEAWPGRPLRQARALYPRALYIPADPARCAEAWAAALRALEHIAPEVEPDSQGCAYAGVAGLERLYGVLHEPNRGRANGDVYGDIGRAFIDAVRDATGLTASVAVADGKFIARVGALLAPPGSVAVVPRGRERAFLRDTPVSLLPFGPEVAQRLRALSLETLGAVAALPRPAVQAQFRAVGGRMWDLANGIDPTPLIPRRTPEAISERLTFESPVVTSEALIMAARQVVRRLSVRLDQRAARRMHTQVLAEGRLVWERSETFRDATSDEGRMMTLLKTRLASLQLTEAVDTVAITLSEIVREPGHQGKLITETNPQLERLLEAVQEIRARFGGPMVWRAVEVDPCSRHPEDRAILIPYDA